MRVLPLLFKFYFIIACYLHVCTRVNIYMCGGQRLTLDILYLVGKPPTAPGANPFGYSGWKKSHRDFPAASSPCCNCRHSYCVRVWFRTGNLSSSPQACIANAYWSRHLSVPFKLIIMYCIQVLSFEELQKGVPGAWRRSSPTSANPWALSMNWVSRVFFFFLPK